MEVLSAILAPVLPILGTILTILLVSLAKSAVDKYGAKIGIQRSKDIDDMIDKYVAIGVTSAQRIARKKLNGGPELGGKSKLALATATVVAELEQSGITDVAEDLIKARIEAFLEIEKGNSLAKTHPNSASV